MTKPRRFILCIDKLTNPREHVWAVRTQGKWITARSVRVDVPVDTVFRGARARQPKAYLEGIGTITQQPGGHVWITP